MEPEVQGSSIRSNKRNVILIILAVFILLMLLTTSVFAYMTLQNDRVYKGVYIGSENVSGMSIQELKQLLDNKYQAAIDSLDITLKTEKSELKASYPELDVHYGTGTAAQNAYAIGRRGNIFERLYDITQAGIKSIVLDMPLSFDEGKLDSFVSRFYDMTFIKVKEGSFLITDSNVTMRSGRHGENIDKVKTLELVKTLIEDHKGGIIAPEVIITSPTKFNVDELHRQIISEPADAAYKVENSTLTLIPHTVGRQIDRILLTDITAELDQSENSERVLPVAFINPNVTSDMATSLLFRDELTTASSYFSTATQNGKNRGFNMGLAVDKINNMILAPGQEFSFNQVVGPRDLDHGFKIAHVYSAGKIIDGVGGGICQVSSTMYNAVLLADLTVVERRNHSFTVGYVPLGQDATAYYGGTDFRFLNSGKWPIKLLATIKGNKISFSIIGTHDTPGKSVIISNKILKETPFPVKYTDDPTLPVGTERETQEGMTGYIVETYKTIKMNDKVLSQTKLHTSNYKAYAQVILRGTKPLDTTGDAAATPGDTATDPDNAATVPGDTTTDPDDAATVPGDITDSPVTASPESTTASEGAIDPVDSAAPDGSEIQDEAPPQAE